MTPFSAPNVLIEFQKQSSLALRPLGSASSDFHHHGQGRRNIAFCSYCVRMKAHASAVAYQSSQRKNYAALASSSAFRVPCSWRLHRRTSSGLQARAAPAGLPPLDTQGISRKALEKEAHKIFDEVIITVKSGDGGNGEIVESGRGKTVRNFKYKAGGNSPKKIFLSASEPADGADGADVVLVCDPAYDNLLHLHQRKVYTAAKGPHGNPAVGSGGPKNNTFIRKARTPPLMIPVPQGTVVKRKGTGQVLGELINPGEQLKVAAGGRGGKGVRAPSRESRLNRRQSEMQRAAAAGAEIVEVEDVNWRVDAKGLPGQQLGLQLLLRVVADVGIVGFPNAGKSSLLRMLTRASPEVAAYPFTTLMPNLGVMTAGAGGRQPVLVDLPGLIEGAHTGRGLGRMFLRHLRRTRVLLHVLDGSAADPATDYWVVREELRMFNPEYCGRPHIVAINKVDLEDARALQVELVEAIRAAAEDHHQQHRDCIPQPKPPASIIPVSALTGQGLDMLSAALSAALRGRPLKGIMLQVDDMDSTASSNSNNNVAVVGGTAVGNSNGGRAAGGMLAAAAATTAAAPTATAASAAVTAAAAAATATAASTAATATASGSKHNEVGSTTANDATGNYDVVVGGPATSSVVANDYDDVVDDTDGVMDDSDQGGEYYEGDEDWLDEEDVDMEEQARNRGVAAVGDGGEDVIDDKAPDDDEHLWLLNISEVELLQMVEDF